MLGLVRQTSVDKDLEVARKLQASNDRENYISIGLIRMEVAQLIQYYALQLGLGQQQEACSSRTVRVVAMAAEYTCAAVPPLGTSKE